MKKKEISKFWQNIWKKLQRFNPIKLKRQVPKMMSIFAVLNSGPQIKNLLDPFIIPISQEAQVLTRQDCPLKNPIFSLDKGNDLPTQTTSTKYTLIVQTGSGDKIQRNLETSPPIATINNKNFFLPLDSSTSVNKFRRPTPVSTQKVSRQRKLVHRFSERKSYSRVGTLRKFREQDRKKAKELAKTLLTKINTQQTLETRDQLLTSEIIKDLEQLLELDAKLTKQFYDYLWISNPFRESVRISKNQTLKLNQLYNDNFKDLSFSEKAYFIQQLKKDLEEELK